MNWRVLNPVCGTARLKIRNKGAAPLTSCEIHYGLNGNALSTYQWSGQLKHMESEVVELPFGTREKDWWGQNGQEFQFIAYCYKSQWPARRVASK
ncbi:MAG: hypothetical protein U5L96_19725 [Owenweeksia sp.]|nr:hypothetical protein [Owenweeksia sp.]